MAFTFTNVKTGRVLAAYHIVLKLGAVMIAVQRLAQALRFPQAQMR